MADLKSSSQRQFTRRARDPVARPQQESKVKEEPVSSSSCGDGTPCASSDSGTGDEPVSDVTAPTPDTPKAPRKRVRRSRSGRSARARMQWTPEMHEQFERSVQKLGGPFQSTPKAILEHMQTDGLSLTNVKSHLQKYRLKANKKARQEDAAAVPAAPGASNSTRSAAGAPPAAAVAAGGGGAAFSRHLPGLLSSPGVLPNNMVPVAPAAAGPATQKDAASAGAGMPPLFCSPGLGPGPGPARVTPPADLELAAHLAAWQLNRWQLANAIMSALQQQGPKLTAGPQLERLIELQQEHLRCQQALHTLHVAALRQHLAAAAAVEQHMQLPVPRAPAAAPGPVPTPIKQDVTAN